MAHNFSVPAEDMLQDARTMHGLFLDDKTDFVAKDVDLDDPFAANFLTSIEASEAQETAETREDQQEQETADVLEKMNQGKQAWAETKYYVHKAFGAKPAIEKKFGLDNFSKAAASQAAMSLGLTNLHKQCEDPGFKPQLLTAGMIQAQIDFIQTAKNGLLLEDTEQNIFRERSPEATAERDAQYNDTFEFMQKINRASKIVYYGNLIKLNQYRLPHGSEGADFNVEGKVVDGSNNNAELKGVKVRCNELNIETFTNFAGNWGFVDVPPGIHKFTFTFPAYTTVDHDVTMVFNGSAKFNTVLVLAT